VINTALEAPADRKAWLTLVMSLVPLAGAIAAGIWVSLMRDEPKVATLPSTAQRPATTATSPSEPPMPFECEEYFRAMRACSSLPPEAHQALRDAEKAMRQSFKSTASNAEGVAALTNACRQGRRSLAQVCK
jgi:uncharacterized membrane protein